MEQKDFVYNAAKFNGREIFKRPTVENKTEASDNKEQKK
jgi:hypothetical protein